jgi:predicted CXXCH cytochrome family protein
MWSMLGLLAIGLLGPLTAEAVTGEHNMSSKTPGRQVCVVCHTPHHAPSSPLLWNHKLSANSFSWSDWTQTSGGTKLPTNIKTWSGSTKLCLSCHDGSVAIGAIYEPDTTFDSSTVDGKDQTATSTGDLKGNHPVSVPYPYSGVKNTYNGITTGDEALKSGWVATPTTVKLYTDASVGGTSNHGIECASCHDPHGTAIKEYLRVTPTGSALCLSCHDK